MRNFVAGLVGFLIFVMALALIRSTAELFGVVSEVGLPYPMERSYGRFASDLVETSDTLFGIASFLAAALVAVTSGYAVDRKTLIPWKTREERLIARAWGLFMAFLLPYSVFVQIIFGGFSSDSWFLNFVVDFISYGIPVYVGSRIWSWWKMTSEKKI